jgi:hypothetical protein
MLESLTPSATQVLRWLTGAMRLERTRVADGLGCVAYEPACVVADDPGEIVRHASPLDDHARRQLREQQIARLRRDPAAIEARERRVAIEHAPAGRVLHARFA